jgi:GNAT superfamily N-acetyltransferase
VRIRIGTATAEDIPDVLASVEALVATDAGLHDAAATNLGWAGETGVAYCASLLASSQNLVLLARDGEQVAGLESIHVYPAHRGRGVGGQLIRAFLVWAAERGAQRATVTAYAANDGARRFYARHGFAVRSVTLDLDDLPRIAAASG